MNKSRKKCFVCTAASSSRWTGVSEANIGDICYYYGVKEQLTDIEFLCQACSVALCKAKQNKKEQGSLNQRVKLHGEQFKKHTDTLKKLRFENLNKHRKITSPIENLPPEVLAHIIYYLDAKTVLNLSTTCRRLRSVADSEFTWNCLIAHSVMTQDLFWSIESQKTPTAFSH